MQLKKSNQLKDDETKNTVLLKNGLKGLIESYLSTFDTFVRNEVRDLAAKEEDVDHKKLSQEIFSYGFNFLERYGTPSHVFKKFNCKPNKHKYSKWWSKRFCI